MWKLTQSLLMKCLEHHGRQQVMNNSSEALPVITLPQKMIRRLDRLKNSRLDQEERNHRTRGKPQTMIISCKRSEYNFHKGSRFDDKNEKALASHGWKHQKSVGDYFSLVSHGKNPALFEGSDREKFCQLEIGKRLVEGLESLGFTAMTRVQSEAIRKIMTGRHVLVAAETGSGKTFSYLIPIIERIEEHIKRFGEEDPGNSPHAIILTPSHELTEQIGNSLQSLSDYTDVTYHTEFGGRGTKGKLAWPVSRKMDILISTPGVLSKLITADHIKGSKLQQIVLDEADTLLDDSFNGTVTYILRKLKIPGGQSVTEEGTTHNDGVQFIMASATLPKGLQEIIGDLVPVDNMVKVTTSGLHRLMPHVPQKFIRISSKDKEGEIIKLLKHKQKPTMVFCNKSDTVYWLNRTLEENNISNMLLSATLRDSERQGRFLQFHEGKCDVLVATDIASRGLDTIRVEHIVNFDFPLFMSDYIHRVGRVGRVGAATSGHITSFVCHKWDVDLLWKIEKSARRQSELYNVNANIKRKIEGLMEEKYGGD